MIVSGVRERGFMVMGDEADADAITASNDLEVTGLFVGET